VFLLEDFAVVARKDRMVSVKLKTMLNCSLGKGWENFPNRFELKVAT
jgi:hypothetical protein